MTILLKVMYIGTSEAQVCWGGNDDPSGKLEIGRTYIVLRSEVHPWHTKFVLAGFPGLKFNSVSFTART